MRGRHIAARGAVCRICATSGAMLQRAGLALPVTDVDRIVVRYENAFPLMAELEADGREAIR